MDALWDAYGTGLIYVLLLNAAGLRLVYRALRGSTWILGGTTQVPRWLLATGGLLAQAPGLAYLYLGMRTAEEASRLAGG